MVMLGLVFNQGEIYPLGTCDHLRQALVLGGTRVWSRDKGPPTALDYVFILLNMFFFKGRFDSYL